MMSAGREVRKPHSVILGRYELVRQLAFGGMGEIYLCRQIGVPGIEREVVLKMLRPEFLDEQTLRNQFLDEARVLATLSHPNIVTMIEVAEWEGGYVTVMEFIHGVELTALIQQAALQGVRIPPRVIASIIRGAAAGLHCAHTATDAIGRALRIIHRDVSPQNIMVRPDGVVKVVDFGVAWATNRLAHTQGNVIKGTLQYMSPEQARHDPLDSRSDQFGLGVVFWEMCTQRGLFHAGGPLDVMRAVLEQPIPPPSSLGTELPPPLEHVVMRMLQRDRDARFPSCQDVATALDAFLEETGGNADAEAGHFVSLVAQPILTPEAAMPPEDPDATEMEIPLPSPPPRTVDDADSNMSGSGNAGTISLEMLRPLRHAPGLPRLEQGPLAGAVQPKAAPGTGTASRHTRPQGVTRAPRAVGATTLENESSWRTWSVLTLLLLALGGGGALMYRRSLHTQEVSSVGVITPNDHAYSGFLMKALDAMRQGDFIQAERHLRVVMAGGDPGGQAAMIMGRLPDEKIAFERLQQVRLAAGQDPLQVCRLAPLVPMNTLVGSGARAELEHLKAQAVEQLFKEGTRALEKRDFDSAREKAAQALEVDPQHEGAHKLLSAAHRRSTKL